MNAVMPPAAAMSPRTRLLLHGPVLPTLLKLAWPNTLVMLAQASVGLIETWWVAHLGTDALAGMALVFPGFMMMQMLSGGAIGGGISSAIARALGGGRRDDADALVLHALVINIILGLGFTVLVLWFGPSLYAALGGEGGSLRAALAYSDIVFGGAVLIWLSNAFASVLRGTGNMMLPSISIIIGVVVLVPLSPLLIYGWGPVPAMGIAGAGWAVVVGMALSTVILAWAVISGRSIARLRWARLRWALFRDILAVGAVASVSTLQTTLTIALTTAVVARAGGPDAVAGYGTGTRLEYLLVPLVFGLGAPLVALVGTNIGAGQGARALRIALTGGALAFVITETVGLAAAIWPEAWLGLFGADPRMLETGAAYLRVVGPTYGFFGLGLSLYFASQGAGRLGWPLVWRVAAAADRGGGRLGGPAPDGIADLGIRRAGGGAGRLRCGSGGGDRLGRLVSSGSRAGSASLQPDEVGAVEVGDGDAGEGDADIGIAVAADVDAQDLGAVVEAGLAFARCRHGSGTEEGEGAGQHAAEQYEVCGGVEVRDGVAGAVRGFADRRVDEAIDACAAGELIHAGAAHDLVAAAAADQRIGPVAAGEAGGGAARGGHRIRPGPAGNDLDIGDCRRCWRHWRGSGGPSRRRSRSCRR